MPINAAGPPACSQAGADAAEDLEEVLQLRADCVNQTGPLSMQAANLAKYYRLLTWVLARGLCLAAGGLCEGAASQQRGGQAAVPCGSRGVGLFASDRQPQLDMTPLSWPQQERIGVPGLDCRRSLVCARACRLMEARFPISRSPGHANVEFGWSDAFRCGAPNWERPRRRCGAA